MSIQEEVEDGRHVCDRDERWMEYDGRGIESTMVCEECVEVKLAKYRPNNLSGYTQADVDEPIEEDVW